MRVRRIVRAKESVRRRRNERRGEFGTFGARMQRAIKDAFKRTEKGKKPITITQLKKFAYQNKIGFSAFLGEFRTQHPEIKIIEDNSGH